MNDALKSVGADDQTTHSGVPFKVSTTVNSSMVQSDSVGADDETTHGDFPFRGVGNADSGIGSVGANDETTHCRLLPSGHAAYRLVNGRILNTSARDTQGSSARKIVGTFTTLSQPTTQRVGERSESEPRWTNAGRAELASNLCHHAHSR